MSECPRARETDLLTQPLGDELLVFDETANRAHSLNATAAAVWRACDGTRSPGEIAEQCQIDGAAVELALQDLADANLLADYSPPAERVSRRAAIRRMALTGATVGIALPVIRSIVAPSAATAGSLTGTGCPGPNTCGPSSFCSFGSTCQPGHSSSHGTGTPCVGKQSCSFFADCSDGTCGFQ